MWRVEVDINHSSKRRTDCTGQSFFFEIIPWIACSWFIENTHVKPRKKAAAGMSTDKWQWVASPLVDRDFSQNTLWIVSLALTGGILAGWLDHEASSKRKQMKTLPIGRCVAQLTPFTKRYNSHWDLAWKLISTFEPRGHCSQIYSQRSYSTWTWYMKL